MKIARVFVAQQVEKTAAMFGVVFHPGLAPQNRPWRAMRPAGGDGQHLGRVFAVQVHKNKRAACAARDRKIKRRVTFLIHQFRIAAPAVHGAAVESVRAVRVVRHGVEHRAAVTGKGN
ncbi:MAG: hypothetical protein OXU94_07925 [Gammaproteobacteria bacterium]|nr:hypothetical protein [Gammaproteobacteria bacterium]